MPCPGQGNPDQACFGRVAHLSAMSCDHHDGRLYGRSAWHGTNTECITFRFLGLHEGAIRVPCWAARPLLDEGRARELKKNQKEKQFCPLPEDCGFTY